MNCPESSETIDWDTYVQLIDQRGERKESNKELKIEKERWRAETLGTDKDCHMPMLYD